MTLGATPGAITGVVPGNVGMVTPVRSTPSGTGGAVTGCEPPGHQAWPVGIGGGVPGAPAGGGEGTVATTGAGLGGGVGCRS